MSSDDDPEQKKRRGRRAKKKRVTLTFQGPPLALPGEQDHDGGESELGLDTSDIDAGFRREESSPFALELEELPPRDSQPKRQRRKTPAHDAWTRDRIARGSDIHSIDLLVEHAEALEEEQESSAPPQPADPPVNPGEEIPDSAETSDAIGLVERSSRTSSSKIDLRGEMDELFALGDFTGALRVAELLLGHIPDSQDAMRTAKAARQKLEQLYTSRFGSLSRIPEVAVPDTEVRWLGLDHRAGFLLSRVDGVHSIEQIVDVSGMERLEALRLLVELLDADTIRLADRAP